MRHVPARALGSDRRLTSLEKLRLIVEVCELRLVAWRILRRQPDARAAVVELRRRVAENPSMHAGEHAERVVSRLAWSSRAVLERLPGDHRCLAQSLVLTALLARRGIDSRVVIGVRNEPPSGVSAHAWVTIDGRPVSPPGDHAQLVDL